MFKGQQSTTVNETSGNDIHFVESDAECLDHCQEEDTSKIQLTNGIASVSNQQLRVKGNT